MIFSGRLTERLQFFEITETQRKGDDTGERG